MKRKRKEVATSLVHKVREQPKNIWLSIRYYAEGLWKHVDEDHCFLLAAGVAFNVLYCLIPLSLVVFFFIRTALTGEKAVNFVVNYISDTFPTTVYQDDLELWIRNKLTSAGQMSNTAGILGLLTLIWLSSLLFSVLRTSVNAVFQMETRSHVLVHKLVDFLLLLIIMVLLLGTTMLPPVLSFFKELGSDWLPSTVAYVLDSTVPFFVSLFLSLVLYVILFRILPHERLEWPEILVSAGTTVVLNEIVKFLFSIYTAHATTLGALYGAYAFLVGTSLWIYYTSLVFLIGAEVGWLYRMKRRKLAVS